MSIKIREAGNKVLIFAGGMVLALLFLELGLRIFGALQEDRAHSRQERAGNSVLCVGDSFTYGMGAPSDRSYPRQLENLLNTRTGEKWTVVNLGHVAANSSLIYDTLEKNIEAVNPRVVVILAGGANVWNYKGYGKYRRTQSIQDKISDHLYDLRAFKLAKLLVIDLRKRISPIGKDSENDSTWDTYASQGYQYKDSGQYEQAIATFKEGIQAHPFNDSNYCYLIRTYKELGRDAEAEKYYEQVRRLQAFSIRGCHELGDYNWSCSRRMEALQWYEKGVLMDPYKETNVNNSSLRNILQWKDEQVQKEIISFARLLRDRYHIHNPFVDSVLNNEKGVSAVVDAWLACDMDRIIGLCRGKNAFVVVQNYPRDTNDLYGKIADKYRVPLVDNTKLFGALLQKEPAEKYFIPDGHCNAAGYGVMAEHVYDTMAAAGIIRKAGTSDVHHQGTRNGK